MKDVYKIFQIEAERFKIVRKYKSTKEASNYTGINKNAISDTLIHSKTHKLGNYYWIHGANLLNFINEKLKQSSTLPLIVVKHLQILQMTYGKQENNT